MTARVKAVLRRVRGSEEETKQDLTFPGLTVSLAEYDVRYEGRKLEMPPKELEVLYFLAAHQGQVFTREQLLEQVCKWIFAKLIFRIFAFQASLPQRGRQPNAFFDVLIIREEL